MTASISKLKLQHSLSKSAWLNYGLDVLNITMHTEVVIHSMNAYVWCWCKICGSKTDAQVQQDFKGQGHYEKVKDPIKVTP